MLDVPENLEILRTDDDARSDDVGPSPVAASSDQNGRGDGSGGTDGGGGGESHLQKARREGRLDLRNCWQVVAGSILIPLGVVFILIAWYGAAHARVVQQQIPYLVSGSFVGLGCMVVGGFLFFGHWLYRMYDQAELHHEEQLRALEAIAMSVGGGVATASGPAAVPGAAGGTGDGAYYATSSGTVYHRADCTVIAHHREDLRALDPSAAAVMQPCQICRPG